MAAVPFTSLFLGDGGLSEEPIHTMLTSSKPDKSKCVAITCSRSCIHTTMWGPLIIDDQPSGDVPQSLLLTKPPFYNPHSHRQHLRPLYSQAVVHELQAVTGVEVHRAHLLCDRQSRRCWWPCWPDHTLVRVKQIANMCGALPVGRPFIMNSCRHFENYWDILVGLSLFLQFSVFTPSGEIPISTSVPNRPYWFFWAWTWAILGHSVDTFAICTLEALIHNSLVLLVQGNLFVDTLEVWSLESRKRNDNVKRRQDFIKVKDHNLKQYKTIEFHKWWP